MATKIEYTPDGGRTELVPIERVIELQTQLETSIAYGKEQKRKRLADREERYKAYTAIEQQKLDLKAENAKLKEAARESDAAMKYVIKDLLLRADRDSDGTKVVNLGAGCWIKLNDASERLAALIQESEKVSLSKEGLDAMTAASEKMLDRIAQGECVDIQESGDE